MDKLTLRIFGKIDYCYFCLPIVLHHTKTICKVNHEIQGFELLEQIGQKMHGFLY